MGGDTKDPFIDEYESLPSDHVLTHMTAGAIAGTMEHCIMYPLDSVKTRMQSLAPGANTQYRTVFATLSNMVKTEGHLRPIRGISAVVMGAGPAHALYFGCYEHLKYLLIPMVPPAYNQLVYGFAGCIATIFHDAIMTPADAVKQRMQMRNSQYMSCWDCIKTTYRSEGLRAFYRSYTTQLSMNVPFQSINFMCYEFAQKITNPESKYNPKAHMMSGAFAGGVAAAVTTPLDVCKTLLNTQESKTLQTLQSTNQGNAFRFKDCI